MKHYENDCVGCPQGCCHCGREDDYPVWECDECGERTTLYEYDGLELCENCLLDKFSVVEGSDSQ